MKNLITIIACTVILLGFVSQFFANQITHTRLSAIENIINGFQGEVRLDGGLNDDNISNVKARLADVLECDREKFRVVGSEGVKKRGEMIAFTVMIPKKDVIVAVDLWHLGEAIDGDITIRRSVVSEKVSSL